MENEEKGFNKYTSNLGKWTHIVGLKKWENPIAEEYQITATPTYFILDAEKRILSKPEFFIDVKAFFEKE